VVNLQKCHDKQQLNDSYALKLVNEEDQQWHYQEKLEVGLEIPSVIVALETKTLINSLVFISQSSQSSHSSPELAKLSPSTFHCKGLSHGAPNCSQPPE
jgi:hypothetical protein